MTPTVILTPNVRTMRFAARELARHLRIATGGRVRIGARMRAGERSFRLGLASDLGVATPADLGDNDWFAIVPDAEGCRIAGANPRSVLFGVYRYLRELGFRWIRPGRRGEVNPSKRVRNPFLIRRRIVERAS
nr:hypothetical protein [Planctomycetota bacterium]